MPNVRQIGSVDLFKLQDGVAELLNKIDGWETDQISLTSPTGEDDWDSGIGRLAELEYPEKYYSTLNESLKDTYLEELIKSYNKFYRWRLLRLNSSQTYTVHCDSLGSKQNLRIHIPVWSNDKCFLCFYSDKPESEKDVTVQHVNLKLGTVYEVNTSSWHTAANYSNETRWHIVGVRYE